MTRGGITLAGLVIVAVLAAVALCADLLPLGSPTEISKDLALRGPTAAEPFGMDASSTPIASRWAWRWSPPCWPC